jgi:hypothetical protein
MHRSGDDEQIAELRQQLLEYCHLDTLAMVRILEKMREMVAVTPDQPCCYSGD